MEEAGWWGGGGGVVVVGGAGGIAGSKVFPGLDIQFEVIGVCSNQEWEVKG